MSCYLCWCVMCEGVFVYHAFNTKQKEKKYKPITWNCFTLLTRRDDLYIYIYIYIHMHGLYFLSADRRYFIIENCPQGSRTKFFTMNSKHGVIFYWTLNHVDIKDNEQTYSITPGATMRLQFTLRSWVRSLKNHCCMAIYRYSGR